jgi:hypothetical protein
MSGNANLEQRRRYNELKKEFLRVNIELLTHLGAITDGPERAAQIKELSDALEIDAVLGGRRKRSRGRSLKVNRKYRRSYKKLV